jgi:hypothetical protein
MQLAAVDAPQRTPCRRTTAQEQRTPCRVRNRGRPAPLRCSTITRILRGAALQRCHKLSHKSGLQPLRSPA